MAYTASFGGGFSATISFESQGGLGGSGGGTNVTQGSVVYGGQRWPDVVGALHYKSGWGEAQVSGVIHNVNVRDQAYYGLNVLPGAQYDCGVLGIGICNASENKVGWGIDAGVKVNLPSFGAGDDFLVTGSYTQNAVWYSGLMDGMWGENGQVNGNGQPMYMADAAFNPLTNTWAKPTAWSVSGLFEHHFTPAFYVDLEASIGGLNWSNQGGGCYIYGFGCGIGQFAQGALSPHATSWIIGADIGWMPVTNLNFDLELMYQSTTQDRPSGFLGTVYNAGEVEPVLRSGRLGRQLERFRWPLPHHPLLLIATRSVEIKSPGAKAPGFFRFQGPLGARAARIERRRRGIFGLRIRRRRPMIARARPETCGKSRPAREGRVFALLQSSRIVMERPRGWGMGIRRS